MAYTGPNSFGMIGGFNITSNQPIDSRIKVNDINDVINIENWRGKTGIVMDDSEQEKPTLYNGLIVSDNAGNVRVLVDADKWNLMESWKEIGGGAEAIVSESDPTTSDDMNDGYKPGQLWINSSTKKAYILINAASGAAEWHRILDPTDLEGTGTGDMLASVYAKNGGAGQGKVDHSLVSDKLATAQNIKITGDATGTTTFDGSAEANIEITLKNVGTADTYVKVTTDAQGRVVSGEKTISNTEVTGLGTAATLNTGTAEGNIPVLGNEGKLDKTLLPQLDKSDLTGFGTAAEKDVALGTGTAEDNGKVVVLGADGKLPDGVIPSLAVGDVTTVSSKAELITQGTAVQKGDITIVSEESKTYILANGDGSSEGNWVELKTPGSEVTSVNGLKGAVTLTTDNIAEGSTNQYYTEERGAVTFGTEWAKKTTDNLTEGTKKFYSDELVKAFFASNTFIVTAPNAAGTYE